MEWITTAITFVTGNIEQIVQVIGVFAIIATATPNKVDDALVQKVLDFVNAMAFNFGNAKNDGTVGDVSAKKPTA